MEFEFTSIDEVRDLADALDRLADALGTLGVNMEEAAEKAETLHHYQKQLDDLSDDCVEASSSRSDTYLKVYWQDIEDGREALLYAVHDGEEVELAAPKSGWVDVDPYPSREEKVSFEYEDFKEVTGDPNWEPCRHEDLEVGEIFQLAQPSEFFYIVRGGPNLRIPIDGDPDNFLNDHRRTLKVHRVTNVSDVFTLTEATISKFANCEPLPRKEDA